MSKSRGHKVKTLGKNRSDSDVFWLSLEEAKQAIADRYEFLAERYERKYPKEVR